MDNFELTIRNGTVATATETTRCDVGISGEKIVATANIKRTSPNRGPRPLQDV